MWVKSQSQSFATLAPKFLALNLCLILKNPILYALKVKVQENPKFCRFCVEGGETNLLTLTVKHSRIQTDVVEHVT